MLTTNNVCHGKVPKNKLVFQSLFWQKTNFWKNPGKKTVFLVLEKITKYKTSFGKELYLKPAFLAWNQFSKPKNQKTWQNQKSDRIQTERNQIPGSKIIRIKPMILFGKPVLFSVMLETWFYTVIHFVKLDDLFLF